MKTLAIAILLAGSMLAYAQDKPSARSKPAPSSMEQLALRQLAQEAKAVQDAQTAFQKDMAAFQTDFAAAHPGWAFDPAHGIIEAPKPAEPPKK